MKVLVLLSLVAVCFSRHHHNNGKHVTVREDGSIGIRGSQGKEIEINKNFMNPRRLDMVLRTPTGLPKRILVDEANTIDTDSTTLDTIPFLQNQFNNMEQNQLTQHDILFNLFLQYQGIVNEATYQTLLEQIQTLVNSGLIHESVFHVLRNLDQLSGEKYVSVREDGLISITGTQGREIDISRNIIDPTKIDIILRHPLGTIRKIEVDATNLMDVDYNTNQMLQNPILFNMERNQMTQADILATLFRQFEGIVDEPTFEVLLERLQTLVKSGLIHQTIYEVVSNLDQFTGDKHIIVREDGTVNIMSTQGREIDIHRNIFNPRMIDMVLRNPMGVVRKIQVEEANRDDTLSTLEAFRFLNMQNGQTTQADILAQLFRQYEGIVDEKTFQDLLEKIQVLVNSGLVHETVFDILRNLEQLHLIEELKRDQRIAHRDMSTDMFIPIQNVHDVREVITVEGDLPSYLRTVLNNQEDLKYRNYGVQGLWNQETASPLERYQILLQQARQQQLREHMTDILNQQWTQQQRMDQLYQQNQLEKMTPFTRYMNNLKEQQRDSQFEQQGIQQWRSPLTRYMNNLKEQQRDSQFEQQGIQQWNQQQRAQQWNQQQQGVQQLNQQQQGTYNWMRNLPTVVAQRLQQKFHQKQVVPQQWRQQVSGLDALLQQGEIMPQEYNMMQQHYQRMMPTVMMMQ